MSAAVPPVDVFISVFALRRVSIIRIGAAHTDIHYIRVHQILRCHNAIYHRVRSDQFTRLHLYISHPLLVMFDLHRESIVLPIELRARCLF